MRGEGRTRAMVEALPETGAFVVVHNAVLRRYVMTMIRQMRGAETASRCRVVAVSNHGDLAQLVGASRPIVIDHAVEDEMAFHLRIQLHDICAASNAMFPS